MRRSRRGAVSRGADAAAAVELRLRAAELGDGLVAVHPLARDPVPVGARAQLREHRQREHLHAPAEQVLRAHVLVAHLAEVARARVRALDHHLRGDLGRQLDRFVGGRVPPDRVPDERQQVVGVDPLGFGQEARLGEQLVQGGASPSTTARWQASSSSTASASMRLNSPKSRNATRPSSSSRKFPGCGSPENCRWRYRQPRKKRKTISPMPVALGLRAALQLLEADAGDVLADEHALARERA